MCGGRRLKEIRWVLLVPVIARFDGHQDKTNKE